MKKSYLRLLCLVSLMFMVLAPRAYADDIEIIQGHIRETIPGTSVSAAYMTIKNSSEHSVMLTAVSSAASPRVEIHEHVMSDDMMRMQQRASLTIAANSEVVLQPMGFHVMMFDLVKPLRRGEQTSLTLHFVDRADITIDLPVQSIKNISHHQH